MICFDIYLCFYCTDFHRVILTFSYFPFVCQSHHICTYLVHRGRDLELDDLCIRLLSGFSIGVAVESLGSWNAAVTHAPFLVEIFWRLSQFPFSFLYNQLLLPCMPDSNDFFIPSTNQCSFNLFSALSFFVFYY